MPDDIDDPFPVPKPDPPRTKKKPGPEKGSQAAKDAAARAVQTRRANAGTKGTVAGSAEVREVRDALADAVTKAGALMLPVVPIPGAYCVQTGEDFADAVARLAAKNPKLLKQLRSSSSVMDYVAIGSWLAGLGIAVGVQFGKVPANSGAADVFGITDIAEEFYPEETRGDGAEPEPPTGGGLPVPSILERSPGTPADVMAAG